MIRPEACPASGPGRTGFTLINIQISDDPVTIKSYHAYIQIIFITGPVMNFDPGHASW